MDGIATGPSHPAARGRAQGVGVRAGDPLGGGSGPAALGTQETDEETRAAARALKPSQVALHELDPARGTVAFRDNGPLFADA